LMAIGYNKIYLAYDCLGLGVMSFLTAFAITFPAKLKSKLMLLLGCILSFQLLNIVRFMLLALSWKSGAVNHHTVFNLLIYALITVTLYLFIEKTTVKEAS
jgi:exosortase/archaeosortase family protein